MIVSVFEYFDIRSRCRWKWIQMPRSREVTRFFFYKNFGSAPSTKSFLIWHENFAIIVLKVS